MNKARLSPLSNYLLWLSIALCALAVIILGTKYVHAMATTSLWVDEHHTVKNFAQKGLWHAWTDYSAPNNHILFSMILSLVPTEMAFDPFWARLPSFLLVCAALIGLIWFGAKEGALGAGILAAALVITNDPSMQLTLQARGYGLLFFAAVFQSVSLYYYLTADSRKALAFFYVFAVAGGATVPIYVILVACTCLAALALNFKWEFIIGGIIAAIIGLLFHVPTLTQIIAAMTTYGEDWGRHYASLQAPLKTLGYFFPEGQWALAGLLVIASVALVAFAKTSSRPTLKFLAVALISVLGFLLVCRVMETPLVRTTQYIAGVVAVALVILAKPLGAFDDWTGIVRRLAISAVLILTGFSAWTMIRSWHFIPLENYMGAARFIEAMTPGDTPVYAPFRSGQMQVYMRNPHQVTAEFDADAFARGEVVYVDADMRAPEKFKGSSIAPGAVDFDISQQRSGYQRVSLVPQRTGALSELRLNGEKQGFGERAFDRDLSTFWTRKGFQSDIRKPVTITFSLKPGISCRTFVWVVTNEDTPGKFSTSVRLASGKRLELSQDRITEDRHHILVDLSYLDIDAVDFEVKRSHKNRFIAVHEAWCAD